VTPHPLRVAQLPPGIRLCLRSSLSSVEGHRFQLVAHAQRTHAVGRATEQQDPPTEPGSVEISLTATQASATLILITKDVDGRWWDCHTGRRLATGPRAHVVNRLERLGLEAFASRVYEVGRLRERCRLGCGQDASAVFCRIDCPCSRIIMLTLGGLEPIECGCGLEFQLRTGKVLPVFEGFEVPGLARPGSRRSTNPS
jgi:hypothetical protein